MTKVAVLVLNWNGADMLRKFLPYVLEDSQREDVEVYVVDNASTDDSLLVVQKYPRVHIVRLDQNYGFAEGYNRAIFQVEAEYVVLLNSDVEVTSGWLDPMVNYMDSHSEVAACQPKLLSWRNRRMFEYAGAAGGFLDKYGYPYCRGRVMGTVEEDYGQYDSVCPVLWASGAALFIRRKEYLDAGGLDATFFAHMEEVDLCWRLRTRGKGVVCVPESVVYHVGAATLKESPHKTFLNFRNNLLMLYKNLPQKNLHRVMWTRAFLDYVAAVKFLLTGGWGNFLAVLKARRSYFRLLPQYHLLRKENLQKRTVEDVPEHTHRCILLDYYFRGKKTY